jgi:hypothetical protein
LPMASSLDLYSLVFENSMDLLKVGPKGECTMPFAVPRLGKG